MLRCKTGLVVWGVVPHVFGHGAENPIARKKVGAYQDRELFLGRFVVHCSATLRLLNNVKDEWVVRRISVTGVSRKQRERERQAQLVKDRLERSRRPAQRSTNPVTSDHSQQDQRQQHQQHHPQSD